MSSEAISQLIYFLADNWLVLTSRLRGRNTYRSGAGSAAGQSHLRAYDALPGVGAESPKRKGRRLPDALPTTGQGLGGKAGRWPVIAKMG